VVVVVVVKKVMVVETVVVPADLADDASRQRKHTTHIA
jgi:hypothetical protein